MKTIGVNFVTAKNKDLNNGQHMVIQTNDMQLVGFIRTFSKDTRGEEGRRKYLESKSDPCFFAKAIGYRVFISLYASLADEYTQEEIMENKYEIHHTLQQMAQFYAENMTDGMRRHFADSTI